MSLLSIASGVFSSISSGGILLFNFFIFTTYGASLLLCTAVLYPLAAEAYALFWLMAELNYSALGAPLQHVIANIQIFTGIFMLFISAFSLLQFLIDPEAGKGKNLKSFFIKIIIVLALIVSSSFIFNLLDSLQHAIIGVGSDNLIEKMITGNENFTKSGTVYDNALKEGKNISYSIFFSMYHNSHVTAQNRQKEAYTSGRIPLFGVTIDFVDTTLGKSLEKLLKKLLSVLLTGADLTGANSLYTDFIEYHFPVFTDTVGVFLIIMFVKFAIDVGVRNIVLLFLRMIFPIMALSYLLPNKKGENFFTKYIMHYLVTYASYFVKVATIYIIFYMITWLAEQFVGFNSSEIFSGLGIDNHRLVKAILLISFIVAVFMFYTKALPAIAKKVFGIEMTGKNMFSKAAGLLAGAVGFAVGGAMGAVKGAKAGGFGAALKGMAAGAGKAGSLGNNVGKSAGAGKIADAFKQGTSGFKTTRAGINDAVNNSKKVKDKAAAFKAADEADSKHQALKAEAEKAKERAALYDANDNSSAAKVARLQAAEAEKAEKSAEIQAQKAIATAKSYDKNYKTPTEIKTEQKVASSRAAVNNADMAAVNYEQVYAQYSQAADSGDADAQERIRVARDAASSAAIVAAAATDAVGNSYNSPIITTAESSISRYEQAERDLNDARQSGNTERIASAQANYDSAKETATSAIKIAKDYDPSYVSNSSVQVKANESVTEYARDYDDFENARHEVIQRIDSGDLAGARTAMIEMKKTFSKVEKARAVAKDNVNKATSYNDIFGINYKTSTQIISENAKTELDAAVQEHNEIQREYENIKQTGNGDINAAMAKLSEARAKLTEKRIASENADKNKDKYNFDRRLTAEELELDKLEKLGDDWIEELKNYINNNNS